MLEEQLPGRRSSSSSNNILVCEEKGEYEYVSGWPNGVARWQESEAGR